MSDIVNSTRSVFALYQQYPTAVLLSALTVTVLLLAWGLRRTLRSDRPDKRLAILSLVVGFAWSAEAMWEVATQKLQLSYGFAIFAFFIFESQLAVAMLRAERSQRVHGHPGKYATAAWLTATAMGGIAALAGDSPVEVVLRLAVPLLVTHQWWVGMTGDGATKPANAISWTWTPRQVLVVLGLARPGEQTLQAVDRHRQVLAIARVSHRLHSTSWRFRKAWYTMRLRRLAMKADDEMLNEARLHVERVWQAAERTRPLTAADRAAIAAARREAAAALADAEEERRLRMAAEARAAQLAAPHTLNGRAVALVNGGVATNGPHLVGSGNGNGGSTTVPATRDGRSVTSAVASAARSAGRRVPLPATEAGLRQWLAAWATIVTKAPHLASGAASDADCEPFGFKGRYLRKVRAAAMAGLLRQAAERAGVPLPAGYVDDRAELAELTARVEVTGRPPMHDVQSLA